MALSIPTITLNDGRAMPLLGLGTYKSTEKEAEKAIVTAAKIRLPSDRYRLLL